MDKGAGKSASRSSVGLTLALVLIAIGVLTCTAPLIASENGPPRRQIIVAGGDHNYPPFEFMDEEGNPGGFNVELLEAVARTAGLEVEFRLGPWEEVLGAFKSGEIDVLPMFRSEERAAFAAFSEPHAELSHELFVRKGGGKLSGLEELVGKKVIVQQGAYAHDHLLLAGLEAELILTLTEPEAIRLLASGEGDCALLSRVGGRFALRNLGIRNVIAGSPALLTCQYSLAVRKGETALLDSINQGLSIVKADGRYHEIYDRYLGVLVPRNGSARAILKKALWVVVPLILAALLVLVWSRPLKRGAAHYQIAAVYVIAGSLWIFVTDALVAYYLRSDPGVTAWAQMIKGWVYVAGTGLIMWLVVRYYLSRMEESAEVIETRNSELARANRAIETVSECNQAMVRAGSEKELLDSICRNMVDLGGHLMAWVGLARRDRDKSVEPAAFAGVEEGFLERARITWSEEASGQGPSGRAIRTGKTVVIRDLLSDPGSALWREESARRGYASAISLPLRENGETLGCLTIYSGEKDAFDEQEVLLLEDLARDLSYGITAIRTREERDRALVEIAESKRWFEAVVETAPSLITVLDQDGGIILFNKACEEATGYARREVMGKKMQDFLLPGQWAAPFMERLIDPDSFDPDYPHEHPWITKTGERRIIEWRCSALPTPETGPRHILGTGVDITERKELEQQLRQSQKMEAVGRLAGGIAHDFNNMLSVINGYADLVLSEIGEEAPLADEVREIRTAGDRAVTLTRQLLAFSRKQVLKPEIVNLNEIIKGLEKMLHRLIGEDVELVASLAPDLGLVKADPGQMEQVIMNLAINSREAMPTGGKLTIETRNVELEEDYVRHHLEVRPGPYVMMAVTDTGTGMDQEVLARIFEPFFTTKEGGTGLGLATVYGIVKQSNGNIWVYSEPGQDTSFKIYLPRVRSKGEVLPRTAPLQPPEQGAGTVLVVEDDQPVRNLAERILAAAGYRVLAAEGGDEALDLARECGEGIDLLLTDVVMPGMSGKILAEKIRLVRPEAKVLYMSGYMDDAIVRHGVLERGIHFIGKPFTISELTRKVREVLEEGLPDPD